VAEDATLEPSTVLRRNPRVEFRSVGDEEGGVLLHLDTAAYHGLNGVGALAWSLLDGITFQKLLEELREQLEGIPPTFEEEIAEFVEDLAERDLVHYGESGERRSDEG
jgi:Coenzyme PQQ synthesis protein D (PqqD)